jgi:hypothetical protein
LVIPRMESLVMVRSKSNMVERNKKRSEFIIHNRGIMQDETKRKAADELNDKPFLDLQNFHLAGVIPVAGHKLDFGMEWDECLSPISPNYTLIENAIYECAWAGCDTIWVVVNDDMAPLLRHRIGERIQDPIYVTNRFATAQKNYQKHIPIFYVPIHPKDRDKRDCLAWSVLHGAVSCLKISDFLSKWIKPDKYYVSFPFSVFNSFDLREHRRKIRSKNNFYVTKNGLSVEDNLYASFTFGKEEFVKYRRIIRQKGTGMYDPQSPKDERGIHTERLPIEERYSARHFDLQDVFIDIDVSEDNSVEPSWYYDIGSWEEYCEFPSNRGK